MAELTTLLVAAGQGDRHAAEEAFSLLDDDLRCMAKARLRQIRISHRLWRCGTCAIAPDAKQHRAVHGQPIQCPLGKSEVIRDGTEGFWTGR